MKQEKKPLALLFVSNGADRKLLTGILRTSGFTVSLAKSAADAAARAGGRTFDVIVLDADLSGADGRDMLASLRHGRMKQDLPVIAVAGADPRRDARAALQAGANDVLTRPIDPSLAELRFRAAVDLQAALRRGGKLADELTRKSLDLDDAQGKIDEAQSSLAASIQQYSAIMGAVAEAIITIDVQGRIIMLNDEVKRLWGYSQEELLGRPVSTLMPSHYVKLHEAGLAHYRKTGEGPLIGQRVEVEGLRKDGTIFPIEICIREARAGQRVYLTAACRDITAQKEMEDKNRQALEQALEAAEAKTNFLANMSHEIRTPLNGLIGLADLLGRTQLDARQKDFVDSLQASGKTLLHIVNEILDFTKIEANMMQLETVPFRLRALVEKTLDMIAPRAAEKNVAIACRFEHTLPEAWSGDSGRIGQVLLNLLTNAVKFTEHGEVEVRVDGRPLDGRRHEIRMCVRDTGVGMSDEDREHLFQAFHQVDASTSRRFGGTGLGLAICKYLVELMGGVIWVESRKGVGSEFYFTVPLEAAADQPADLLGPGSLDAPGREVLVIHDEPAQNDILRRQLAFWGVQARVTPTVQEAFLWLQQGNGFSMVMYDPSTPSAADREMMDLFYRDSRSAATHWVLLASLTDKDWNLGESSLPVDAVLRLPVKVTPLYQLMARLLHGKTFEPAAAGTDDLLSANIAAEHPLRILVVEDNNVNQKVALNYLSVLGYQADLAENGKEALEMLDRSRYDVVLMDVQMPVMDGLEATRRICRKWEKPARPRIIAMTANDMPGDRERFHGIGMDGYLGKPFMLDDLIRALRGVPVRDPASAASGPASVAASATVDMDTLRRLRKMMGGSAEVMKNMLETFLKDTPAALERLPQWVKKESCEEIRRLAHNIKSTAGAIGAQQLREKLIGLEQAAVRRDMPSVAELAQAIREDYGSVEREIKNYISSELE